MELEGLEKKAWTWRQAVRGMNHTSQHVYLYCMSVCISAYVYSKCINTTVDADPYGGMMGDLARNLAVQLYFLADTNLSLPASLVSRLSPLKLINAKSP
jgi:hypothetical protein